jgi:hypothetical protein
VNVSEIARFAGALATAARTLTEHSTPTHSIDPTGIVAAYGATAFTKGR